MLQGFFSATVVGYYALGTRVLRVPMNLLGTAIGRVFFQRAAQAKNEGTLDRLVESAFRRLVALGLFPMFTMAIVGRDVFVTVFGPRWEEAGVYTQILSVWMFVWFISSPLGTLFAILEKQELGFWLNGLIFVTRFASLAIGGWLGDARLTLTLFAISGICTYGYQVLAVVTAARVPLHRTLQIMGWNLLAFAPAGAALTILVTMGTIPWLTVATALVMLLAYYCYIAVSDPQFRLMLANIPLLSKYIAPRSLR